jgi:hypothetical protein
MSGLAKLAASDLRAIAASVRRRGQGGATSRSELERVVAPEIARSVSEDLARLYLAGATDAAVAECLELMAETAGVRCSPEDAIQLVTSGPELGGMAKRDTYVVVQDLFRRAEQSVLVSGYSIYDGRHLLQELADRMVAKPEMQVRMFLNIERKRDDPRPVTAIVDEFARDFGRRHWPAECRLPEVYYDLRSLGTDPHTVAVLHAKCVVIDRRELFISSAKLTEAAHNRNIEIGVLVESEHLAGQVARFFDGLISGRHCLRVPMQTRNM